MQPAKYEHSRNLFMAVKRISCKALSFLSLITLDGSKFSNEDLNGHQLIQRLTVCVQVRRR